MTNEEFDITIIEIKPNEDKINNFLEIDENAFEDPRILKLKYKNMSAYLLHYPKGGKIQASFGWIDSLSESIISHSCSSEYGSSGSPLFSLKTFKVIGVHLGAAKYEDNNKDTLISYAIYEFKKYKNENEEMADIFIHFNNLINEDNNINVNINTNNEMPKDLKKEGKIKLIEDLSYLRTEKFLILNEEKLPFSNYIDINQIKEVKLSELKESLKKKDYIIYNFLSLVIFNPNSIGSPIDLEFNQQNKIIKIENCQTEEIVYSLCYLKHHKLYALGLYNKIYFYDTSFKLKIKSNLLENQVSYIYELKNGKILVTDYSKTIKLLNVNENNISLYEKLETKNTTNFVGIELNNDKIICGGKEYLSIIESNFV